MQLDVFSTGLAGFLSGFSPCVLPILPFFLALMTGLRRRNLRQFATTALIFACGFALMVFWLVTQSGIGAALVTQIDIARPVAAAVVALIGVGLLIGRHRPILALPAGLAFGFGWVPCVGPVLSGLLNLPPSVTEAQEAALFSSYAIGSVLALVGVATVFWPLARRLSQYPAAKPVAAALLILFAGLLATDRVTMISAWLLDNFDWSGVLI